MCGRCRCTLRADDVPRACYRNHGPYRTIDMDRYRPSYNVPPGANFPVVRRDNGGASSDGGDSYALHCMKWGLIPSFTKKTEKPDFYKMFNAQCESLKEKASFRRLLPKNRCLVAVEGFYEWKKDGSKKQPYYVHFKDGRPLVFAALYDSWKNSEDETLYTFTIITTNSSSTLRWLHNRMPVILGDKGSADAWLMDSSSSKFETVLKPYEGLDLGWYPVTPAVGKPSFDGPECVKELKTEAKNPISKFFTTKQIKKEEESKPEAQNSIDESAETKQLDRVKEESEIGDNRGIPSLAGKEGHDSKPEGSAAKGQTKRNYEEFSEDSKPHKDDLDKQSKSPPHKDYLDKQSKSPVKKKKNLKGTGDKQQATVLSYFRKK